MIAVEFLCLLVRASMAVVAGAWGGPLGIAYAVGEGVVCVGALLNVLRRVETDRRPVALLVPVLYLSGCFVVPVGDVGGWLAASMWAVSVAALVCRLWMLQSITVGVPSWHRLVDGGPFRVVRHPCMALSLLGRVVFVAGNPSAWNAAVLAVSVAAAVLEVLIEEGFLRRQAAWCRYAAGVRWRLCPFLW